MTDQSEGTITDPADPKATIKVMVVGPIQTNCYAFIEDGHAMVVDPGADGAAIARELGDVTVDCIVATHGHGDHVGGVAALKEATGAPFLITAEDAERASHAGSPGALGIAYDDDAPAPDRILADGDVISVGSTDFTVIATPGHTPGGVVLLADGVAFTGDTVFKGAVGRTDLAGGDTATLMDSVAHLKEVIPPDTLLLPGHDESTTMAAELAENPYFS